MSASSESSFASELLERRFGAVHKGEMGWAQSTMRFRLHVLALIDAFVELGYYPSRTALVQEVLERELPDMAAGLLDASGDYYLELVRLADKKLAKLEGGHLEGMGYWETHGLSGIHVVESEG